MTIISKIQEIPWVKEIQPIDISQNPPGRKDQQYKLLWENEKYTLEHNKIIYIQEAKKISFIERYKLGRLVGRNAATSVVWAIFKTFTSQTQLTSFYCDKLRKIKDKDFFFDTLKFYKKRGESHSQLEARINFAFNHTMTVFDPTQPAGVNGITSKAFKILTSINYDPSTHKVTIERDKNILQTICEIPYRKAQIASKQELIVTEDLLKIPDEPIFSEVEKIQNKFLEILGFKLEDK